MRESLERHRRQPEVSTDYCLRQIGIASGASIASRRKLYLDTRYWILLRNAMLGRARSPQVSRDEHGGSVNSWRAI